MDGSGMEYYFTPEILLHPNWIPNKSTAYSNAYVWQSECVPPKPKLKQKQLVFTVSHRIFFVYFVGLVLCFLSNWKTTTHTPKIYTLRIPSDNHKTLPEKRSNFWCIGLDNILLIYIFVMWCLNFVCGTGHSIAVKSSSLKADIWDGREQQVSGDFSSRNFSAIHVACHGFLQLYMVT